VSLASCASTISAPIWLRALPPLHRQAPTGSKPNAVACSVGELGSYRLVAGATAVLAYLLMPMVRWVAIGYGVLARPNDRFAAHPVPARELHPSRLDPAASSKEHRRLIPVQRNRRRCPLGPTDTLAALLVAFAPCFTARAFPTFQRWSPGSWHSRACGRSPAC
jgi:hypothetical protein